MANDLPLSPFHDSVYARPGMTHQVRQFDRNPGRGETILTAVATPSPRRRPQRSDLCLTERVWLDLGKNNAVMSAKRAPLDATRSVRRDPLRSEQAVARSARRGLYPKAPSGEHAPPVDTSRPTIPCEQFGSWR